MQRQHHWSGVPRRIHGHQPKVATREVQAIRDEGFLTATVVAQELGIGATTLRRLEGMLFGPVPRRGTRHIRVFTREQVAQIRAALRKTTRLGSAPELLSLAEVARRAGCSSSTLQRYQGKELPAGRRLAQPQTGWGFTLQETKQIVAWVKRHVRKRRSRRPNAAAVRVRRQ